MNGGFDDPYTGLFTRLAPIPRRAHDPEVFLWGGAVPPWGPRRQELSLGGAGWEDEAARDACIGEGIERLQAYALPDDAVVESSFARWSLDEPAVEPERWVLFHPDQHREEGFPFALFGRGTTCRWVCFRDFATGGPRWIPEELGFLFHAPGSRARLCPSTSTGLSCGRSRDAVVGRGLQEVVERDGVLGAWWGRYPLEEWDEDTVLGRLESGLRERILRPNLRYRYYRVDTPFSAHVTLVTIEEDNRGGCGFATGSACRETRAASWRKSILEAIQGAAYVRQLRAGRDAGWTKDLSDFAHHAAYYAEHPERLKETVLHRPVQPRGEEPGEESPAALRSRLGDRHPVLVRAMTPPAVTQEFGEWRVVRVVVPGLQPLHGNHRWPHLGGPLWGRPVSEWASTPPHPFA